MLGKKKKNSIQYIINKKIIEIKKYVDKKI